MARTQYAAGTGRSRSKLNNKQVDRERQRQQAMTNQVRQSRIAAASPSPGNRSIFDRLTNVGNDINSAVGGRRAQGRTAAVRPPSLAMRGPGPRPAVGDMPARRRPAAKLPIGASSESTKVTKDYATNSFSRKPVSSVGSRARRAPRNTFALRRGR